MARFVGSLDSDPPQRPSLTMSDAQPPVVVFKKRSRKRKDATARVSTTAQQGEPTDDAPVATTVVVQPKKRATSGVKHEQQKTTVPIGRLGSAVDMLSACSNELRTLPTSSALSVTLSLSAHSLTRSALQIVL